MDSLGKRIKSIRDKLSQSEFADAIGVSQRTVGHYEKDERAPDAGVIKAICAKFAVNPGWLLFGENPEEKQLPPMLQSEDKEAASAACQRCYDLYDKLVQSQEREIALILENAALKAVEKTLRDQLSLSATEKRESA